VEKEFLTARELQEFLGLGQNTVYTLLHRQDFPSIRIGRSILVPKKQLMEWIAAQAAKGQQP